MLFPDHAVAEPDDEVLFPEVIEAKSSLSTIGTITKSVALVPVPNELVTEIFPLVAAAGTVAVIWVGLFTVNEAAGLPLNATPETSTKFDPVKTTEEPTEALVVLKEETTGQPFPESTVKRTGAEKPTAPSISVACAVIL